MTPCVHMVDSSNGIVAARGVNLRFMAINIVPVSKGDVTRILNIEEGHFVDVKSIDIAPSKLTKTLSAFANADGGDIYIGIDEDKVNQRKSWRGFSNQEAANAHIQVLDDLFPLGGDFSYEFMVNAVRPASGLVLHVTIQKSREIKTASDQKPYVRRNAASIPVISPESLEVLRRNKGITSFETETVATSLNIVTNSEVIIGFMLAVIPIAEPYPWLRKQQMIREDKPTVAAVLLFSDEPQAILPKRCAIKIYRYRTSASQGTRETLEFDPITIEGCLYDQIRDSVSRTQELIQEAKVVGKGGLETIKYPEVTLHEIITNAVLHRDYSVADDIHVRIFDNRVEIESPGRLPAHINERNILTERFSRNGVVVRMINKFPDPPNKDVGEGLNTAFAAMKKLRLTDPIIRQTESAVLVEIRHQHLGSLEKIVMEYLDSHDEITNRVARDLSGIGSENTVKDAFKKLAKNDQIERVPGKNGNKAAWQKRITKVFSRSTA
jgi:ATP-dependent DNA helicase RecG